MLSIALNIVLRRCFLFEYFSIKLHFFAINILHDIKYYTIYIVVLFILHAQNKFYKIKITKQMYIE